MTTQEIMTTIIDGQKITCNEYKRAFFNAHGGLDNVETSPMNSNGNYMKYYRTGDGHVLFECNGPEYMYTTDAIPGGRGTVSEIKKFFVSEIWTALTPSVKFREIF